MAKNIKSLIFYMSIMIICFSVSGCKETAETKKPTDPEATDESLIDSGAKNSESPIPNTIAPISPPVSVPPVTVPPVTVLPVTVLPVTVLPVTVLPVTVLPVTVLPVTVPPVTVLPVTVLPVTVPPVTVPPVTVPPVIVPPVIVPPVTVPPVIIPPTPPEPLTQCINPANDIEIAQAPQNENFENLSINGPCDWESDRLISEGPFTETGEFFTQKETIPPQANRNSLVFGSNNWLTAELYSRDDDRAITDFIDFVDDPSGNDNTVLKLSTLKHTDGAIIRSSEALPENYRISMKVGFAQYGDGESGLNGYDSGDERAEPWGAQSAISENGFYWLAILDSQPKPHNNTWIHHHRKFVIDSDNNHPAWMQIYNGHDFESSGKNPIMVIAPDGKKIPSLLNGSPFISYAGGEWQESGEIRAVDAYLPNEWYQVTFIRQDNIYTFKIEGNFKFSGINIYEGSIDAAENCIWHYNRNSEELNPKCINNNAFDELGEQFPFWPQSSGYDDYFMIGDPHINYYEGHVYFDDIQLEELP
jgi:hypothetical protein